MVHLENREWIVEDLAALPAEAWAPPGALPTVEICIGDREVARAPARAEMLIGTSEWCELRLPVGLGLPPHWGVLAHTNRGWELFSLTEKSFTRAGEQLGTDIEFDGPDEVEQGDVRLVFRPGAPLKQRSGSLSDTGPLYGVGDPEARETPFYRRCERLCEKVVERLRKDSSPATLGGSGFGLKRFLRKLTWPKEPTEELRNFETDLEKNPADIGLVRKLGEFFDRFGFDNLHGRLLIEVYKRDPHDAQLLVLLAEIYSRRAMQTNRPPAARSHSASEAHACLVQALKLRPNDPEIRARLTHAAGQMALLKGGFSNG